VPAILSSFRYPLEILAQRHRKPPNPSGFDRI